MFGHDVVVAVRQAIWERHGNAIEWAVRVIDDFRAGFINDACSYCSVHRPATHDDVIAAIMAARQNHEYEQVESWKWFRNSISPGCANDQTVASNYGGTMVPALE